MKTETIILDRCIKWIKEHQSDTHKKLPSENELADKLKVPRNVVRKAYEWLDLLGYTYSQQGKGRFIRARKKKINLVLSGVESFSEKIRGLGHHLDTQIITSKKIRFNEYIYAEIVFGRSMRTNYDGYTSYNLILASHAVNLTSLL